MNTCQWHWPLFSASVFFFFFIYIHIFFLPFPQIPGGFQSNVLMKTLVSRRRSASAVSCNNRDINVDQTTTQMMEKRRCLGLSWTIKKSGAIDFVAYYSSRCVLPSFTVTIMSSPVLPVACHLLTLVSTLVLLLRPEIFFSNSSHPLLLFSVKIPACAVDCCFSWLCSHGQGNLPYVMKILSFGGKIPIQIL